MNSLMHNKKYPNFQAAFKRVSSLFSPRFEHVIHVVRCPLKNVASHSVYNYTKTISFMKASMLFLYNEYPWMRENGGSWLKVVMSVGVQSSTGSVA
jgi:hypothetical protein